MKAREIAPDFSRQTTKCSYRFCHLTSFLFRVVEMQKYNDPLPGRHGYLANPPFYGSTLVEAATASNRESVGNQSQQAPSLNGDFLFIKRRPVIQGTLNPVWHGIGKQETRSSLEQPWGNFYRT